MVRIVVLFASSILFTFAAFHASAASCTGICSYSSNTLTCSFSDYDDEVYVNTAWFQGTQWTIVHGTMNGTEFCCEVWEVFGKNVHKIVADLEDDDDYLYLDGSYDASLDGECSTDWSSYIDSTAELCSDVDGDTGADVIVGSDYTSTCSTGGGNYSDYLDGNIGDDVIWAGDGADYVQGGTGGDDIHGGSGVDSLHGGSGNDYICHGGSADSIWGDTNTDYCYGCNVSACTCENEYGLTPRCPLTHP